MGKQIYLPSRNADIASSYCKLPHTVVREVLPRLSHYECKLFMMIWDYTLGTTNHKWIAISITKLSLKMGCNEKTVRRNLSSLEEKDLIIIHKAKSKSNSYFYNCYRIKPGLLEIRD